MLGGVDGHLASVENASSLDGRNPLLLCDGVVVPVGDWFGAFFHDLLHFEDCRVVALHEERQTTSSVRMERDLPIRCE